MKLPLATAAVLAAAAAFGGFWDKVSKTVETVNTVNTLVNGQPAQPQTATVVVQQPAVAVQTPVVAAPAAPAVAAPTVTAPAVPAAPAVDAALLAQFAAARTTATDTEPPTNRYGSLTFKKPSTPEQIAAAKSGYLVGGRKLEQARLSFEKGADEATVCAALAAFPDAAAVDVNGVQMSSFAPLALLRNATDVTLHNLVCADLAPLAACGKVRTLGLKYCTITDFSPLAALQALETLSLYGATVQASFAPLAACPRLKKIDFYAVKATKDVYDSLGTLKQVKDFHGGLTKMTSLAWLANVPQTEAIQIFAENIDDLSPLADLVNLTYFRGWNMDGGRMATALGDLSYLANCRKLKKLELPGSAFTSTAVIATFTDLEELDLSRAKQPVDVSFVANLPKLKRISLSGTEVVNGVAIPARVRIYKDKNTKGL